jgi:Amt family ammonium transporter
MNTVAGSSFAFCLVFVVLEVLAIAGLTLINTGLGRSRNAAHTLTTSLCVVSVATLVYFVWGFALQDMPIPAARSFGFESRPVGLFLRGASDPGGLLCFFSAILNVGIASLIPLGAALDRWRLSAACISTLLFAGLTYPIVAWLAWHSGGAAITLQSKLGATFLDVGGSGVIQATGGFTALAVCWLVGPRLGKYSATGVPNAIPAHNVVLVMFGCVLAWVGWLGLNSAGAILNAGVDLDKSPLILTNTSLSATAAALTAAAATRIRFRKPDASLIANGWMAGLVASSAGCSSLKPATSVLTGLVAGAAVVFSVEALEFRLKIDDPGGSISVHAIAGVWGLLAVGIFAGATHQLWAQIVGIATLLGFILPMSYGLNWVLAHVVSYRAKPDQERQGLDLHDLGADAYPEFVTHSDEFVQR